MINKQWIAEHKRKILIAAAAAVIFLSIAGHAIHFWEQPALAVLGLFIIVVPVLAWGLYQIMERLQPRAAAISRKRLIVLLIPSVLLAIALTWFYYRVPAAYHVITITPVLSQNQRVELIELKSNASIVPPNEKNASANGWQVKGQTLVATSGSRPLKISFKAPADAPVILLFYASPESGTVAIALEGQHAELDLKSAENRQTTSAFHTRTYRGIPNWIFQPSLIALDILTFTGLILGIFILQETGQDAIARSSPSNAGGRGVGSGLLIVLAISIFLHLINALAVPLVLYGDSPSYLVGSFQLLKFGNLDISMLRGPGSTFLFAPVIYLFGRNPWGMKILLHVIAVGCAPLAYRLGWQLGKDRRVAFASGLAAALCPDLFLYSNIVMSDLPNIFFVLLCCTLLISALETFELRWIMAAMLTASFAALLRAENLTLLLIGFISLSVCHIARRPIRELKNSLPGLGRIGLALCIALLPILWWSAHNQKVDGYFGLSNFAGAAIYDGWIYFGDASGLSFSDQDSPAVQEIDSVIARYPTAATDQSGTPTSWEVYSSLIEAGYSPAQAFGLLEDAARESLKKDPGLDIRLLTIKIEKGLKPVPEPPEMITLPLPSENYSTPKMGYFDEERLSIPALIEMQRAAYDFVRKWYRVVYPPWVYLCIFAAIFCLYRSPKAIWITLVVITGTCILVPNILGLSHWRYTFPGLIPLQILGINWIAVVLYGASSILRPQT